MAEEDIKAAGTAPPQEAAPEAGPVLATVSPHVRSPESIPRIMWTVSATLVPAMAWAVYVFGPRALLTTAIAVVSAIATEGIIQMLRRKPVTISDGSAFLSGVLVAFVLPAHVPWYVPMTAAIFAMAIVKQLFGGLGCNVWHPALMGRVFVMAAWAPLVAANASWPAAFGWQKRPQAEAAAPAAPAPAVDAVTGATHLTKINDRLKAFNSGTRGSVAVPRDTREARDALRQIQEEEGTALDDLYFGCRGGCIGEVSACLLFLGGIVLVLLNYIRWQVPVLYIGTVALLSWALPISVVGVDAKGAAATYSLWCAGQPLVEIFAGGLFLGAFYMATDMVTSPVTAKGQVVFAIGCALLTVLIRRYGGYPEGVCYAIVLMNTATPLINRYTKGSPAGKP